MGVGSGASLIGTVVIFFGHDLSQESQEAYRNLRDTAGPGMTVRWLLDMADNTALPNDFRDEIVTYDSTQFDKWGFPIMGKTMLPGHCHFPLLRLFANNPGIEKLWLVEYDVRFTGRWELFFKHFIADTSDLLACHVRTREQEPNWKWWDSLKPPLSDAGGPTPNVRAFLVVARYSAAALRQVIASHEAGWSGHQEVLIPSLLLRAGLRVSDFNKANGTQPARRFYVSVSDKNGSLEEFGTVRFRPARSRPGLIPNTLYHPVKPRVMVRERPLIAGLLRKLVIARRLVLGR